MKFQSLVHRPNSTSKLSTVYLPNIPKGTALIKVKYVALCRTDIYVHKNIIPISKPITLGHEFTGTIHRLNRDYTGESLHIGQRVTVNPYYNNTFMGVDFDGAISNYVLVPISHIKELPDSINLKQGCYFEPVAAAMAALNHNFTPEDNICLYGNNRISDLTSAILSSAGIKHKHHLTESSIPPSIYNVIIETGITNTSLASILQKLNRNGVFILKSRSLKEISFPANLLASRNITLKGMFYGDWDKSLPWIESHLPFIDSLIGKTFPLEQWEEAFSFSETNESKKILIEIPDI